MMREPVPLTMVPPDRDIVLVAINAGRGLRRRLNDMGLNEGVRFRVVQSQMAGPCIVAVDSMRFMLGHGMARKILVREA